MERVTPPKPSTASWRQAGRTLPAACVTACVWLMLSLAPGWGQDSVSSPPASGQPNPQLRALADSRRMYCVSVDSAPVIDGALDDAAWQQAAWADDFFWYGKLEGQPSPQRTVAYACASKTHLYFGFRCYDTEPDKIVATQTKRQGELYSDDHVEVSLDPYCRYS